MALIRDAFSDNFPTLKFDSMGKNIILQNLSVEVNASSRLRARPDLAQFPLVLTVARTN